MTFRAGVRIQNSNSGTRSEIFLVLPRRPVLLISGGTAPSGAFALYSEIFRKCTDIFLNFIFFEL